MKTEEEKKESKRISAKKWRDKNKDYIKEKNKKYNSYYYFKNKKSKKKLTEEEKKESKKASARKWRESNKKYQKEYKLKNLDKIKEYQKEYQKNNKEKLNKDHQNKKSRRYKSDNLYRFKIQVYNLIKKSFKRNGHRKSSKTYDIIGCSFDEFKLYLESKFEPWMTWENRGLYNGELNYGWDIDHITPLSSSKSKEDIIILNHYTNLQPLCSKVNRDIKRNYY